MSQNDKTTWRSLLNFKRDELHDTTELEFNVGTRNKWYTLDDDKEGPAPEDWLDEQFDSGYGGTNGRPFVAWSDRFVYFCACYDGAEWVAAVPRNPDPNWIPDHIGGG